MTSGAATARRLFGGLAEAPRIGQRHLRGLLREAFQRVLPNAEAALLEKRRAALAAAFQADALETALDGLAELEALRKSAPLSVGRRLLDLLLDDDGRARLGAAAAAARARWPDSLLLLHLEATARARAGAHAAAGRMVSDAIVRLVRAVGPSPSRGLDQRRLRDLMKLWRVIDLIARHDMAWLVDPQSGETYSDIAFVREIEENGLELLDHHSTLFFAEPMLQGRATEKYLALCRAAFARARNLTDRLRAVAAMLRKGIRRAPTYHAAYAMARAHVDEIWPGIAALARGATRPPASGRAAAGAARTLGQALQLLRDLEPDETIAARRATVATALARLAEHRIARGSAWAIAAALADDAEASARIAALAPRPNSQATLEQYLKWALASGRLEEARGVFEAQPSAVRRSRLGMLHANVLQRLGLFAEAASAAEESLAATLARPHGFCPQRVWTGAQRVGELRFAAATARLCRLAPQPVAPEGVIFYLPRSLEQIRRTPVVALMELKRMGWAVAPLVAGTLPIEPTGIAEIDRYAGCIGLDRTLAPHLRDALDGLEDFEAVPGEGRMRWRDLDFSHALWEEATINRRRYSIDYSCPELTRYLSASASWARLTAAVLSDMERRLRGRGLRTGLMIQFTNRVPDVVVKAYCDRYGDPDDFFCLHAANGYQNYFTNFSTNISVKCALRNMTRHPEIRTASFPPPSELDAFYRERRALMPHVLEEVRSITRMRRSTAGQSETPLEARIALARIRAWRAAGGKVACAFGKVVCDSGVPFDGGPAHRDMRDWIDHSIASVAGSNTLLLIKPHPHELNEQIGCFLTERFEDIVTEPLNDNCLMLGHRWFDIHALEAFVDLGLIYNGTTAIELGVLGVPCVLAGHFGPIDYPIGHAAPRDRAHYAAMLRFEAPVEVAPDLKERAAAWLHCMSGDEVTVPYRYNARQITNRFLYPSYWFEEDVNRYLAEGDPHVARIVRRAVGRET